MGWWCDKCGMTHETTTCPAGWPRFLPVVIPDPQPITLRDEAALRIAAAMLTATSPDEELPNPEYIGRCGKPFKQVVGERAYAFADALVQAGNVNACAGIEGPGELRRQRDALLALFRRRKEYDDKSVLDDIYMAAGLLERQSGEIGYAAAKGLQRFVRRVEEIIAECEREKGAKRD